MTQPPHVLLGYMLIVGACIGSFLRRCAQKKDILLIERSVCDHCSHKLSRYELIPIVSRLIQGGKCRTCSRSISLSYIAIEIRSACIWGGAWLLQYTSLHLGLWGSIVFQIIITGLIYLSMRDILYHELEPKVYTITLLLSAYLLGIYTYSTDIYTILVRGVGRFLIRCFGGFVYKLKFGSWGQGVGFGDVLIGVVLGIITSLLITTTQSIDTNSGIIRIYFMYHLLISSSIGIVHQLLQKNTNKEFGFIPYMVTGFVVLAIIIIFFSDYIIIIS